MPNEIQTELSPAEVAAVRRAAVDLDLPAAVKALAKAERLGPNGKKPRATKVEMAVRRAVVARIIDDSADLLTSRGVAYRLVTYGLPKHEQAFRRIELAVLELRDSGLIGWDAIVDNSRVTLGSGRTNIEDALDSLAHHFRRDLWAEADVQVQLWVEKRGIAAIIANHAHALGLDVYVSGGFTGAGYLHKAVEAASYDERPLVVLRFGDLDSSGQRALEAAERRVRRFAADAGLEVAAVVDVAVTPEQVVELGLPTRPNKLGTHTRPGDADWAVELDAMEAADLRAALTAAVNVWHPEAAREAAREAERADRAELAKLVAEWRKGRGA